MCRATCRATIIIWNWIFKVIFYFAKSFLTINIVSPTDKNLWHSSSPLGIHFFLIALFNMCEWKLSPSRKFSHRGVATVNTTTNIITSLPCVFMVDLWSIHSFCLYFLAKLLSKSSNNLQQKHLFDYLPCTCWCTYDLKSLFTLSLYSFHIFLLSTKFILVSFTFLVLKSHNNDLCWLIHSSLGKTFISFENFLWFLLTKQWSH